MYTLLLTLRDRLQHTESFFSYLTKINFAEKILVADGSTDSGRLIAKKIINKHPNLNIEYHDFGFDDSYEKYYKKFKIVMGLIKTKYVLFIDNDDFIHPEGCIESCQIMNADPSIAACGRISDLYIFPKISSCKIRSSHSIFEEAPNKRIQTFFNKPDAIWGLMLRVHGLLNAFNAVHAANFKQLHLMELLFNLQVIQSGKIARIGSKPTLYRRAFAQESSSSADLMEYSLLDKIFIKNFNEQWTQVEKFYLNLGYEDLKALRMYWCMACISHTTSESKKRQRNQNRLYSQKLSFLRSLYYKFRFRDPIPSQVLRAESLKIPSDRES